MANPKTNAQGAELVLRTNLDAWYSKNGTYRGAVQWLAEQLGVSRQCVDNFRTRKEFPPRYVPTICTLFPAIKPRHIRPEDKR